MLSPFGEYLKTQGVDKKTAAKALDVTPSYVSMLAHGQATAGLKLALRVQKWTIETFGPTRVFRPEHWYAA